VLEIVTWIKILFVVGMASLCHIGRKHFVSKSALASILKEVKEEGIPEKTSRSSIKRSREDEFKDSTPYGDLIDNIPMRCHYKRNGTIQLGATQKAWYIRPLALLFFLCLKVNPFSNFMDDCMEAVPSTPEAPWNVIFYHDEVSPGNNLQHNNKRKVQVVYWSFKEFGQQALSSGNFWFPLTVIRTAELEAINGGWTGMVTELLRLFVEGVQNLGRGIILNGRPLFAKVTTTVADESALKHHLSVKGAGGNLCCGLCRNIVRSKFDLQTYDATSFFRDFRELDYTKFALHTDESLVAAARHIERAKA